MKLPMRLGLGQFSDITGERLTFIRQLGVVDVLLNTPTLPGETYWEYEDLLGLRTRIEDAGLRLAAIENVPLSFYDKAMLGLPGRDEQIRHMMTTIRNLGRAGIPILGYHWMPNGVWRTGVSSTGPGGARVSSFDLEAARSAPLTHGREFALEEMWDAYAYFMSAVLGAAQEAGVRLALHPDDPPVESLGGIPRLFRNFAGFQRAMELADSPMHGLDFCVGSWSAMETDVLGALRSFGERGKIVYVHFRDVQGVVPRFQECFLNQGNCDMLAVMRTLKEVGFSGFVIPDHVPYLIEDRPWRDQDGTSNAGGYLGRAHAIGYMSALLDVVNSLD